MRAFLILLLAMLLGGCATTGNLAENDPYEKFNRGVWAFNDAVDTVAIRPATQVYRTVTPVPARRGISNVLSNLSEPFSFINNLLQGKPDRAFNALGRFLVNSTIGVGGLADHATDMGLPRTREDFGQTLAVHGMRNSPYLVLPFYGPSTVRDALGIGVQLFADPARIVLNHELTTTQEYVVTGIRAVDSRSGAFEDGTDRGLRDSADPYAVARSAFFQLREAEIRNAEAGDLLLTPEEEKKLLDDAIEDSMTPPAEPPGAPSGEPPPGPLTEPPQGIETQPQPSESPSTPETALLDIVPPNVLREDSVSGGD